MDPVPTNPAYETMPRERQLYYETLMSAEQLGNKLVAQTIPVSRNSFYRVSNPLAMRMLVLPVEFLDRQPSSVCIEFDETNTEFGMIADSRVVLEFAAGEDELNDKECHIPISSGNAGPLGYDVIPVHRQDEAAQPYSRTGNDPPKPLSGTITRLEVSNLIARTILPGHDTGSADYTRLDNVEIRQVIMSTLEETEYVSTDTVSHFEFDGQLITTSYHNGYMKEISITLPQPGANDRAISLRIELDHHSSSQEIFVEDDNGSTKPRAADPEEIEEFHAAIKLILSHFERPEDSLEQQRQEEQGSLRKKPAEERLNGGRSPAD